MKGLKRAVGSEVARAMAWATESGWATGSELGWARAKEQKWGSRSGSVSAWRLAEASALGSALTRGGGKV